MKVYDLIIIGAGPAGMTASIYAKRANLDVLLMEKSAPGGQMISTAEIENYTGAGKVSGVDLAMKMFEHVQSLGVETMFEEVVKVHDLGSVKEVVTPSQTLQTKAVLITAGANPRTLGVKGEDDYAYRGISWCAICDGPLYKDKRVLVVGGGNSAVEESLFLSNIASHITIVQNLDRLTADPKAVSLLMKTPNVDIIFNAKVISFNGDDALKSVDVETKDGVKSIEVDGVFEYIGLTPVSDFVSHLGITNEAGYIVVNSNMETKVKGIFSAGDVNQKQIRQVVTATSDGAIAVQNIIKYLESLGE
jgi:thioredoxin reductase (NADPH)